VNLYLLSQTESEGYTAYESLVVCAKSEADARLILPSGLQWAYASECGWCSSPELVIVMHLGVAVDGLPEGVVSESLTAG